MEIPVIYPDVFPENCPNCPIASQVAKKCSDRLKSGRTLENLADTIISIECHETASGPSNMNVSASYINLVASCSGIASGENLPCPVLSKRQP